MVIALLIVGGIVGGIILFLLAGTLTYYTNLRVGSIAVAACTIGGGLLGAHIAGDLWIVVAWYIGLIGAFGVIAGD